MFLRRLHIRVASIIALIGGIIAIAGGSIVYQQSEDSLMFITEQLVAQLADSTRKPSAIAVYVEDDILAKEITEGLVRNDLVMAAVVTTNEGILAQSGELTTQEGGVVIPLIHPFIEDQTIGKLSVYPDIEFIQRNVSEFAMQGSFSMLLVALCITVAVAIVTNEMLSRPLLKLSREFERVDPSDPDNLQTITVVKKRQDELGKLISRMNGMISATRHFYLQEKQLRKDTEKLERQFRLLFERATIGIALISPKKGLLQANPAFRNMLGDITSLDTFCRKFNESGQVEAIASSFSKRENAEQDSVDLSYYENGEVKWVHCLFAYVSEQRINQHREGEVLIEVIVNDITERMRREEQVRFAAEHDPLTGLHNRRGGEPFLRNLISASSGNDKTFVLMMIDLDKFKPVNDEYGHEAGDKVLEAVGSRIPRFFADATCVCCRWGGDEFVVGLLAGKTFLNDIDIQCKLLIDMISVPVPVEGVGTCAVSATVGAILLKREHAELTTLLAKADELMYAVKREHRGGHRIESY